MDTFGITDRAVGFAIAQVEGFFKPSDAERAAAFDLLVELTTRTTVAPLADDEGLLSEALDSIHLVFDITRSSLHTHGAAVAKDHRDGNMSLGVLSVRVLNDVLRPVLAKWHPALEDYEATRPETTGRGDWERQWERHRECREALVALRADVRAYIDVLGQISGAPGLAAAAVPLPKAKVIETRVVDPSPCRAGDKPRAQMVRWFDFGQLVRILRALRKSGRGRNDAAGTPPTAVFDADGEFWFDYVADLGDAFDPTMAVAWQVAAPAISLPPNAGELATPPSVLPRGRLLILGGDEVYPYASDAAYHDHLALPYRMAWQGDAAKAVVVAVPGNHDWIGGIASFEKTFVKAPSFAEHWDAPQQQRWFAVKLPRRWWLWGIDTGLHGELGAAQAEFFENVDLQAGDRVILCTPVPLWKLRQREQSQYRALRGVFDSIVRRRGASMPLFLSGDSHFFAHHVRVDGLADEDHVTAGGGGAFLHPTHNLAERLPYETGSAEFRLDSRWPSAAESRALTPGMRFDSQLRSLVPVAGILHVAYALLARWRVLTLPGTPARPNHGWNAFKWTAGSVPGLILLLVVASGAMLVTRPNSAEAMLARGAKKWGFVHGLVQVAAVFAVAATARWLVRGTTWWMHYLLAPAVGAVVSLVLFGFMSRVINNRVRVDDDTAFSRGHLTRYKNFLRLRIDEDGDLTVYAIGLDPVGEGWYAALRDGRPVPPYDSSGMPRLHYLWGRKLSR